MLAILLCVFPLVAFAAAPGTSRCGGLPQSADQYQATIAAADTPHALNASERAAVRDEIEQHGWPTIATLGRDRIDRLVRAIAAQPADQSFVEAMTGAMGTCAGVELDRDVATDVNDRLELALGHPQQFGTQYELHDGQPVLRTPFDVATSRLVRGIFAMPPIEDETAHITARALSSRATLPPLSAPDLRRKLLAWRDEDQALREAWIHAGGNRSDSPEAKAVGESDTMHTNALKALWTDRAIPGASAIGIDGVGAAFLLIQHASDTAWARGQQAHLQMLLDDGSLSLADYALYDDRVRINQHLPQRYGSQFHTGPDGREAPYPIEDPSQVDARRARMNLPPLAEYQQQLQQLYAPAPATTH